MRTREVPVFALALAACLPCNASETEELPALGSGLSVPVLVGAGLAAAAIVGLASQGGGGDEGDAGTSAAGTPSGGASPPSSGAPAPSRTLAYTSGADFRTAEYDAQQGLAVVRAETLYYNGHYRWYVGDGADPAAGSGGGVKIAVADTGINAREAATGSAIAIDLAASYDYVNDRAGSAADDRGHGTHVAGIIAAPRNGEGMHGLAFNASLVNFKIGDAAGLITASDAQLADLMHRAAAAGALILNNSWATAAAITSFTAEELQGMRGQWIEASRAYVGRGGVVVFAAGNEAAAQPSLEAGLPYRIPGLAPGWLAVVAIDGSGALAGYSNACGVAAAWCLAAPGGAPDSGLLSMHNDGAYTAKYGTSMATPHAAAALGALKSMFPNLSYLQLRDRLLFTANRSGRYADAGAYGQGLMDLAAASSPVGGIAIPTGTAASGATAAVAGSGIEFQPGTLRALGMQSHVLVVDNYQRAPFWVPAQTFFREARPRLIERQWASLRTRAHGTAGRSGPLRFSHSTGLNTVVSADLAAYRFGFSRGAGGEAILGSHLQLAALPRLAAPSVDSVALGYASDFGGVRVGFVGSLPATRVTSAQTLESSSFGSRRALGFVAQHQAAAATTYGVSFALADGFERPIGLAAGGAFEMTGSAAASSGAFVQHALGRAAVLEASLEAAQHRPESNGVLTAPAYAVHSASFGARAFLGAETALAASLKREWSGHEAARLHVPLTIDESGNIGRVAYRLPYDDLVGRTAFTLRLDHQLSKRVDLRAAFTHERDGFGATVSGLAAVLEITD